MQGTSAWHTGGASCVMSLRSEHLGLGRALGKTTGRWGWRTAFFLMRHLALGLLSNEVLPPRLL